MTPVLNLDKELNMYSDNYMEGLRNHLEELLLKSSSFLVHRVPSIQHSYFLCNLLDTFLR